MSGGELVRARPPGSAHSRTPGLLESWEEEGRGGGWGA